MAETGDLSRKKSVRAAHRASVAHGRSSSSDVELRRGFERSQTKTEKACPSNEDRLKKLDEKIVEMVPEDGLKEVKQADIVRERIELAISI